MRHMIVPVGLRWAATLDESLPAGFSRSCREPNTVIQATWNATMPGSCSKTGYYFRLAFVGGATQWGRGRVGGLTGRSDGDHLRAAPQSTLARRGGAYRR